MSDPIISPGAIPSSLVALLTRADTRAAVADLASSATADPVATTTRLRKRYPAEVVAAAMTLHDVRTRASAKFPQASAMLLTRAGYEQASSAAVAEWRAQRFAGCRAIADLCCGIGGDLMALAALRHVDRLIAVDINPDHLAMALANTTLVATGATVVGMAIDVRAADLDGLDGVFIDPARRDSDSRFAHGETEPPLAWCLGLAEHVPKVGIKLAPGIDHDAIPDGWELETIARGTELKEGVMWSPALATAPRQATVIGEDGTASMAGPGDSAESNVVTPLGHPSPGWWLHDPNPAVTRAGLVQSLATSLDVRPIDPHIAFLVGTSPTSSPFVRSRPILASLPWDEKTLRKTLADLNAGAIDIRRRGLAGDVEAIARRLRRGLPRQGSRPCWIAMTRAAGRPWAVVCEETGGRETTDTPAGP